MAIDAIYILGEGMSSDRPHTQKEVYVSSRPPSQRSDIIRLREQPDRAKQIVSDCDAAELQHAICEFIGMGYCVSFTATSDGGAVSITVFDGYTRFKGYGRSESHLLTSITALLATVRGEE